MKNIFKIIAFSILIIGCSSDDTVSTNPGTPPEAVNLISPSKDSACNVGIPESSTESTVKFSWSSGRNANSYSVVLTNLSDNTTQTLDTPNTELDIKLLQDTRYSWQVISRSSSTVQTSTSETWEMLNTKLGEQNHAPFPSDIIAPKTQETIAGSTAMLDWTGNDIDNDIEAYDVYLGTTNPPTTLLASTTKDITTQGSGTLNTNTTYYWYVVTKDSYGNSTKSQVASFVSGN